MNKGCEEFLLVTSEHLPEIVDTVELVLVRGSGLGFHGAESFAATARNSDGTWPSDQIFCFVFLATLSEYPAANAASLSLEPNIFSRMNAR